MTSTPKFRSKYHPDEALKRKQDADYGLRTRLSVYCYLMEHSWFDGLSLDIDKANIIMKALDAGKCWLLPCYISVVTAFPVSSTCSTAYQRKAMSPEAAALSEGQY
ncbi:hypothetical protein scyTo_0024620 [Scyliorhinus torazame]|uniref:SERRATE/Ars2 N-terminal domain-containing protein n=1 Tax=Scyliorhinus torazame TaxID=75743 RepID=A0A401QF99_SCYTO|nr:hypothetical protein [Scyliorhinus torazame]